MLISDLPHALQPVFGITRVGDLNVTPPCQWLRHDEHFPSTIPVVVMIHPFDRSRFGRERVDLMITKKFVRLIEANDRLIWVVRFVVEIKHPFHAVDELCVVFWRDYPLFGSMRFEFFF